jgi:hypothetical protein
MTQEHPITPPPALVQQWLGEYFGTTVSGEVSDVELVLATRAARWGADQELEACCEWLVANDWKAVHKHLRAARRPKPPSLKEEALQAAQRFYANGHEDCNDEEIKDDFDTIRRALESLPD